MDKYDFYVKWILDHWSDARAIRVLDFGCGAGQVVRALRENGVEAFGCDVFYEGGNYRNAITPISRNEIVSEMRANLIPFESEFFDLVISNQVMEHVEDLDHSLAEISRVLKPRGVVLSHFPDKGVWHEGHCGVPFLHWFHKTSRVRLYYAATWRSLGIGYYKQGKSIMQWSRDACDWLDRWTHYRTRSEIESTYIRHFSEIRHMDLHYLQARLGNRSAIGTLLPAAARKFLSAKLVGMTFTAQKRS
jgi:SAM-dependent methyltransferase